MEIPGSWRKEKNIFLKIKQANDYFLCQAIIFTMTFWLIDFYLLLQETQYNITKQKKVCENYFA